MQVGFGQHMRADQRMDQRITQRQIQQAEILQLSAAALEERIEQELTSNPTLEVREGSGDEADLKAEREEQRREETEGERPLEVKNDSEDASHADDFERLNKMVEEYGDEFRDAYYEGASFRPQRNDGEPDKKLEALKATPARQQSLREQLLEQWRMVETTEDLRIAGEFLIDFIDADGYIRTERAAILQQATKEIDELLLDEAMALLQLNLEPVGMGASDLRDCLLLQIDSHVRQQRRGEVDEVDLKLARTLVHDHLKDIEANRLPKIAKATDATIDEIKAALLKLRRFHPHPGRLLVDEDPHAITPDAVIEFDEENDCYTARLTNERFPSLHISKLAHQMAKDKKLDGKTREFVKNNIHSGQWLLEAIQRRHSTLERVINVVIEAQRAFFDDGPQHLKPLPMTMVADQLGVDVSTVSRAVSEKYIQSPRGIFKLRMFFSGGTETEDGEAKSWAAVQAKLKEIIDNEDKAKPLSDDALVDALKEAGIEIARRTVAKYRKQMSIPTARQRREY